MKTRKQIMLELDIEALKDYYPKENWKEAYKILKDFFELNGFEWKPDTIYTSKEPMCNQRINFIMYKLTDKHPWLHKCVKNSTIYSISNRIHLSFNEDI